MTVSMGLTVNRQMAKKLAVNRQISEPKLAVKYFSNLVPRAFSLNFAQGPTPKPGKKSWE